MIIEAFLAAALGASAPAELKCPPTHHLPGFPEKSAVVIIDGEIVGSTDDFDVTVVSADDVSSIEITCWSPTTGEIPATSGVQLVLIGTKAAKADTRAEITRFVDAVREFVEGQGDVPRSIDELGDVGGRLDFAYTESGWRVTTTGPRAVVCSGVAAARAADVEVTCDVSYELAERNLREAFAQRRP